MEAPPRAARVVGFDIGRDAAVSDAGWQLADCEYHWHGCESLGTELASTH